MELLDRFGKPRDASIAPALAALTRPRPERRGEHAPGVPHLHSIEEIPAVLPRDWSPGEHPQVQRSESGFGIRFIPLEELDP